MQKLLLTTALAAVMAVGVIGGAAAVPLSLAGVTGQVWSYNNPSGNQNASPEQALPGAQSGGSNTLTSTFSFTSGSLNFSASSPTTIASYLGTGGTVTGVSNTPGTVGARQISTGGFDLTSLYKFTFTTSVAISGTITHDDGVSLFVTGVTNNGSDLLPLSAAAPTSVASTAYSIGPGTYDLYYVEANGVPAQLTFDVTSVPEPATLALLGTGLIGAGVAARRRRGASPSA